MEMRLHDVLFYSGYRYSIALSVVIEKCRDNIETQS